MQMLGSPEPAARSEDDKRSMRCPDCGGLNPADADWCGQCHARFGPPPAEVADDGPAQATEDEFASWLDLLPGSTGNRAPRSTRAGRRFRTRDGP